MADSISLADDQTIEDWLQQGHWQQAREAANARLSERADDTEALNYLGILALVDEQPEQAADYFREAITFAPEVARYQLNAGIALLGARHLVDARPYLERALELAPEDFVVNFQLGRLEMAEGRYHEALVRLAAADRIFPDEVEVLRLMASCLRDIGRFSEAITTCSRAIAKIPDDPWLRNCIALCLIRSGNFQDGFRRIVQLVESMPPDAEQLLNLGFECQEQGSPHAALEYFRKAYHYHPENVSVCVNLGLTMRAFGNPGEALFYFKKATELVDDCADAYCHAGTIYESVRDFAKAVESYEKALEIDPKHAEAMARLASRRKESGRLEEAKELLRKAIELNPDWLQPYLNLIGFLKESDQFDEALEVLTKADERWSTVQEVRATHADLCLKRGDIEGAMAIYRQILAEQPRNPDAMSGMLFCMNYDATMTPEQLADAYKDWDRRFNAHWRAQMPTFRNDPSPERRLRIGYVSGDFRGHSVGFFAEPILETHNHEQFEIFCYANHNYTDRLTARFMQMADHWRWTHQLSDDAVLEMIRLDEIDILIDLSNHTAYNRLHMFARRGAPIQMTWIGMPTTTGVSAIDYRITDARMDPPGMTEHLHAEQLLRLVSGWCYRPPKEGQDLEIGELPALRNGYLTLASFNAFGKINTLVISLWARLFQHVDNAVLYMATGGKDDDKDLNDKVRAVFANCGFPVERLRLFGRKELHDYLVFHNEIDIALDPFPYNGGTVTAHALWMGVPVLSLPGRKPIQRMGASMLGSVGLEEFLAKDEQDYIDIAASFANDLPRLAEIRRTLRPTMLASPLMDAELVTRDLEAAMRQVWREWCERQDAPESANG
ncbi:tetratricopeptide repeat protein [Chitinimonas lacunae]|uniref:protein O-GlcNAc transferase n=1 Tax=Chitinimonas lacunae TaxID=1963018 RepID=A0ABV8MTH1_9NEIS